MGLPASLQPPVARVIAIASDLPEPTSAQPSSLFRLAAAVSPLCPLQACITLQRTDCISPWAVYTAYLHQGTRTAQLDAGPNLQSTQCTAMNTKLRSMLQ